MPEQPTHLAPEVKRLGRARQSVTRVLERRRVLQAQLDAKQADLVRAKEFLGLAPAISTALESLGGALFNELVQLIESKLSVALQEVLEQPIELKVERRFVRGQVSLEFYVLRNGQREEIIDGQGGSVANILSVGLRLFALTTLPASEHRRFLVLDEQDCWMRAELVPRLVRIVHAAGEALGYQVLMISHHDIGAFQELADTIYEFKPDGAGVVRSKLMTRTSSTPD